MSGYAFHPEAFADLDEIWDHIAEQNIVVREYLIAYAPAEKPLWVVAVIHGRRNPRIMGAILQERGE